MKRIRLIVSSLSLAVLAAPQPAWAADCPGAFYHPSTGTCRFTGVTQGACVCQYDCEIDNTEEDVSYFNFC